MMSDDDEVETIDISLQTSMAVPLDTDEITNVIDSLYPPVAMDTDPTPHEESAVHGLDDDFDIPTRDLNNQPEIAETSIAETSLNQTIVEDVPISFTVFEKGTSRGGRLLVSTNGYSYTHKVSL